MAAEENKEIVRRFFEGVLGEGDESKRQTVITEVLDPSCTLNAPHLFNGEISDQDGVRNFVEQIRTAYPDLDITIEESETTENGDVVTRWKGTGTHTGRIESVEPTGASMSWWGQSVSRLSGGKIVAMWWSTISNTSDGNWSTMELDSVMEEVPEDEPLAPDEELYRMTRMMRKKKKKKKKQTPKPGWCRAFGSC
jgi:predicted ester cyclase